MKSNLYTGTGDAGMTSLVGGKRISKTSVRLEAYGTLDEFSSFLGIVASDVDCPAQLKQQLTDIQSRVFDAGSYLATDVEPGTQPKCNGIDEDTIKEIETWIDTLDADTPRIKAFVLPGGCSLSAHCHVARTVCRRAERRILALASEEYVDPLLLKWINRMSDYLFIIARHINVVSGVEEIIWKRAPRKK